MSREFYQESWGRARHRRNRNNGSNLGSQSPDVNNYNSYDNFNGYVSENGVQYNQGLGEICDNEQNIIRKDVYFNKSTCCPFDAYGVNTYSKVCTAINVVRDGIEDLYIPFTISVKIPVGFITLRGQSFGYNLVMDQSKLSVSSMTQHYVYNDPNNCESSGPEVVKMHVEALNGTIYYNLTLDSFIPAQPIQDTNQAAVTYFNSNGGLPIDKVIAYIPFGYENTVDYTISIHEEGQSITLPNGTCIDKKHGQEEYECLLGNPDIEKTLNFSYMMRIKVECP